MTVKLCFIHVAGQVMSELKNIKAIAVFTMHRVENIEDSLKRVRVQSQYERSPSLLPNLPLTELCQLKSLEEKMVDEQFEKQLVIHVLKTFI